MYTLTDQTDIRRTYRSDITGTEIHTKLLYTDGSGNKWWSFEDLLQMPFIRKKASEKVSQLYGVGITKEDLTAFITRIKASLKGSDADRYERAYSDVLQLENIINDTADPVKQSLSLCTVYIMHDTERVDTFSFADATNKMSLWAIDLEAQAFFLSYVTSGITDYTKLFSSITQIASTLEK